jgi:hypothetical protein
MSAPSAAPGGLAGHLDGFVRAVREAGIPVGISQAVDAAEILTVVDLLDREQLRHGLAAVLLQRAAQRPAYDVLFDLWWPLSDRPAPDADPDGDGEADGSAAESTLDLPDGTDLAQLMREELSRLLLDGDEEALRRFAREAVDQLGRAAPSPSGQSFFSYRVMRALSPDTLVARLLAGLLGDGERGGLAEQVARQTASGWPPSAPRWRPRCGGGRRPSAGGTRSRRTPSARWPTRSTSCAPRPPTSPSCAARSPRWPGGWPCGCRRGGGWAGRAGWTSAGPSGRRWAPAACRW